MARQKISTRQALNLAWQKRKIKPTLHTIRNWAVRYALGRKCQVTGKWEIDKVRFLDFIKTGPPDTKPPGKITLMEAVRVAEKHGMPMVYSTIRVHAKKHGFGHQVGSAWLIDKKKFIKFLKGE